MSLNIENAKLNIQDFVANLIGIKIVFKVTEEANRFYPDKKAIHVESEDFAHLMTPKIFNKLKIVDFGTTIGNQGGQNIHIINLNYRFRFNNGGSSGAFFTVIVLNNDGEIIDHELVTK